jgi:16S rRNA (cytidine1402-2'-O)-methyltransferase
LNPPSPIAQAAQWIGAATQHYPNGCLYVLATPIGNMADISVRALHVLSLVDAVACEDTRHTQSLLRHYGLEKPLLAVHEHNEMEMAAKLVTRLQAGERLAYVSDAGTPGVSDPGARLVAAAHAAGLRCMPLPGASSVTAAISVSGAVGHGASSGFVFAGFLSTKAQERAQQIGQLALEQRTVVLLEAPHRIEACVKALAQLGSRPITLAREITKQFEQIVTLPASALSDWLQADSQHQRGEFVLVIHPLLGNATPSDSAVPESSAKVLRALLGELPLKTAVKLAADITPTPKNALYELALQIKASPS